jgi:hypothetical protein
MLWDVQIGIEFAPELLAMPLEVRLETLAIAELLKRLGPQLRRPLVDTLKDSRHANMKEMCFDAAGEVWQMAFAFDPKRKAILLVAGDKYVGSERRSYNILKADQHYSAHLDRLNKERK